MSNFELLNIEWLISKQGSVFVEQWKQMLAVETRKIIPLKKQNKKL